MMYRRSIAWTQIGSRNPYVFREVRFDENALVVDGSRRRKLDVLRHFNNHVRLEAPSFHEVDRRRGVLRIPLQSAPVRPGNERLDSGVAQCPAICEMAIVRI